MINFRNMTIRYFIAAAIIFAAGNCISIYGQEGYSIGVTVQGVSNSKIRLAYHLGNQQFIKDSTITDITGKCRFSGTENLPDGVYMIVFPGNSYFEFLAGDDQHFDVSCNIRDLPGSIVFRGSAENERFIDYQKRWKNLQEEAIAISDKMKGEASSTAPRKALESQMTAQETRMKQYLREVSDLNKGTLLGAIVRSLIPVETKNPVIPAGVNNPDSVSRLRSYIYFKNHFFDNTLFTEPGLIRSPVLAGKLEQYFSQVVIQIPDSVIKEADRVLKMSVANREVYQYVAVWLFNKYATSEIMGHDAVLVHLADKIYLSGNADWVSKEFLSDLASKVAKIRPTLIGKKGADLVMDSFAGHFVSLYDIQAEFTILYFWEPDCGHCKESTPLLKKYYDQNRKSGIEVFAVCTQNKKEQWEKYIADNNLTWINGWDPNRISRFDILYNVESTPLVYILDRDKKIIAKKLAVGDIGSFIDNYRKYVTQSGGSSPGR
jgi:thiol-disulfide isomerase/thioredoxin